MKVMTLIACAMATLAGFAEVEKDKALEAAASDPVKALFTVFTILLLI